MGMTPQINYTEPKQKVDKIIETFKKRVTYKKNYYKNFKIKEVTNNYIGKDVNKNYTDLLEYTRKLNSTILVYFISKKGMIKNSDMTKILNEAEFGFEKMNTLETGINFWEGAYKFFKNLLGNKWKDIKFKLERGYFKEVYNKYNGKKNPTEQDLADFKKDLVDAIDNAFNYIEKELHLELDDIKTKITAEVIKKYLETNEK